MIDLHPQAHILTLPHFELVHSPLVQFIISEFAPNMHFLNVTLLGLIDIELHFKTYFHSNQTDLVFICIVSVYVHHHLCICSKTIAGFQVTSQTDTVWASCLETVCVCTGMLDMQ